MNKWLKLILLLVGSAVLTRLIPFSSLFRNLDTMIHEFCHAIVTLMTSGRVNRIELNADHSGVTYSMITSAWSGLPIGLAGYMGSSLFVIWLFYLYHKRQQRIGIIVTAGIALIMLLLYVHQGFGVIWLIGFVIVSILMLISPEWLRNGYYLLVMFLTLEESVLSSLTILIMAVTQPGAAGDATGLARQFMLPAVVWGIVFAGFSLWCAKISAQLFLRQRKPLRIGSSSKLGGGAR
ncbi:M50 family metallopeptidase [Paenibacillus wulumuqiensis]|uniref:M50 family metallopeptidase n=1 Tax=Paenibacillus wulumuqiensis TaxID=1567107 RepID=UPI00061A01B7|nr:M50 family metallopeptidase [Paenibacillus wulumuqiensis]